MLPISDLGNITSNIAIDSALIHTQYLDGLGRPIQTVIKQGSPLKKDQITPETYDGFGRVVRKYLSYTSNTMNGQFDSNPFFEDSSFYKGVFPDENINYSEILYDGSPLQQIIKTTAPGNSWTGTGTGNTFAVRANKISDSVRLWTIDIINEEDIPISDTFYLPGSLIVEETTEEHGTKVAVFKDESGKTILTKTALSGMPQAGHTDWLNTYFIYDEMNRLRFVLPPKAVEALNNSSVNWNLSTNSGIMTGLCYFYFYDARGRAIMKYQPGKGRNYFAYDLSDRLVMTQDPNLAQKSQWAFIKYDEQSRPYKSGFMKNTELKDSIIAKAARANDYPVLMGEYTITSETYFDDYDWVPSGMAAIELKAEHLTSANFITSYITAPEYAMPLSASKRIRGAVTGIKKIILNSTDYLYDAVLYDGNGKPMQIQQTNFTGATDVTTLQYNYSGSLLRRHVHHQKSGVNNQQHTLLTKYTYDHAGRLLNLIKNIDNEGDKTIGQYTYDELGQLQSKTLGQEVEVVDYNYNIRGWLTGINKDYVDNATGNANYFGETLSYDQGFTTTQLNGSVAGVRWKAAGDGVARAYGFEYDRAGRLTKGDFSQQNKGSTAWTNSSVDFSVSNLNYDAGGNILSMNQRGLLIGNSATIDSLNYQYFAHSNQLKKITDAAINNPPGLGDYRDTTYSGDGYTYDINGNVVKDYSRKMHSGTGNGAHYNLLDKPDSMVISQKATFRFYYDAAGNMLSKKVRDHNSSIEKNYLYINGFVYLNDTLQYVQHEEGRIRWASKISSQTGALYRSFEYDYYLRDHLSNVRTVLTEGRDTSRYATSMEDADSANIKLFFSNVYDPVNTTWPKPAGFDGETNNKKVARLNASTGSGNTAAGPSMVLKVMAGDQVQINTFAMYNEAVQPAVSNTVLLNELLSTLVAGISGQSQGKIGAAQATEAGNTLSPQLMSFINTRDYTTARPKAHLNWVLLDEQFQYVEGNMGAVQVKAGSSKQPLVAPLQSISKNGYLYIYLSNQSKQNVYFDDLTVTHYSGPILQEQSYYPFGLQMAGISSKAMNKLTSQHKFNGGVELEEDYSVNLYNTFYRQYDPQTGRFMGVDPLSEHTIGMTPYQFAGNNPISFNDPLGDQMSYMDQNGFKWKLPDPLGGLSGDRIQYQEGNGWDGFGMSYEQDFLFQMSGSQLTPSFQNGVEGFSYWYSVPGADAKGYTLTEVSWERGFIGNQRSDFGDKYLQNMGLIYSSIGVIGESKLKSGTYIQTNGKVGNFNDRPFNKLSQWGKVNKTFAKNLRSIGKVGNVTTAATLAIDILDDGNIKTSTAINSVLTVVALAIPVTAPFVVAYGILDYAFGFSGAIDARSNGINTGIYDR